MSSRIGPLGFAFAALLVVLALAGSSDAAPPLGGLGSVALFWMFLSKSDGRMPSAQAPADDVFDAVKEAFNTAATEQEAVLLVKLTNLRPDDALPATD